jgi:hypothetical protein
MVPRMNEPDVSAVAQASYRRRYSFSHTFTIGFTAPRQIIKLARPRTRHAAADDARASNPCLTCQGCTPRTRRSLGERGGLITT